MRYEQMLRDQNVLVTGASRGLGQKIAQVFAAQGANIAFNYSRDEAGAQKTKQLVEDAGRACRTYQVSVLDGPGLATMVKDIEENAGQIDILVNNAGISQPYPLALLEEEDWDRVMDINVKGYYMLSRAVIPGMIRRKAGIVLNMGSLAGLRLMAAPLHYSTSKAAIKGFTQALSKEVERYHIRVNCLAPGLLDEGVGQNLSEHRLQDYLENVSLGRLGTLKEVADFAAFMVSPRNTYMNGATVIMDGGL